MGLLEEVVSWAITANAAQHDKKNDRDEDRIREIERKDSYDQYRYEYEKRKDRLEISQLKRELDEMKRIDDKKNYLRNEQPKYNRPVPKFLSFNKENDPP